MDIMVVVVVVVVVRVYCGRSLSFDLDIGC